MTARVGTNAAVTTTVNLPRLTDVNIDFAANVTSWHYTQYGIYVDDLRIYREVSTNPTTVTAPVSVSIDEYVDVVLNFQYDLNSYTVDPAMVTVTSADTNAQPDVIFDSMNPKRLILRFAPFTFEADSEYTFTVELDNSIIDMFGRPVEDTDDVTLRTLYAEDISIIPDKYSVTFWSADGNTVRFKVRNFTDYPQELIFIKAVYSNSERTEFVSATLFSFSVEPNSGRLFEETISSETGVVSYMLWTADTLNPLIVRR